MSASSRGRGLPPQSSASRHASAGVTHRNDSGAGEGRRQREAHAGARASENKPTARSSAPEDDAESTDDEAAVQAAAVLTRRARDNVGYMRGLRYAERLKPIVDSLGGNFFTAFSPQYDHAWMWAHTVQRMPRAPSSYPLWPVLSVVARGNIQRFGAIRDKMGHFRFWWELPEEVQDEPARIARTARSILKATRGADAVYLSDTARPIMGCCNGTGNSRRASDNDDGTVVGGASGLSTLDAADGLYASNGLSTWDADVRRALRLARAYERGVSIALLESGKLISAEGSEGWVLHGGATRAARARGAVSSVWLPPHIGPVDHPAVVGGSGDVNTQASHGAALILPPRAVPAVLREGTSLVRSIAAKKRSADPNATGDVILDAGELAPGERISSSASSDLRVTAQRPILGDAGDVTMQAAARHAAQRLKALGKSDAAAAEAAAAVLGGTRSRLLMRVHSVCFDDHALATEEDWLAAKLRSDHSEYAQRLQADVMGNSDSRLQAVLPLGAFLDPTGRELSSRDVWERNLESRQGGRSAQLDAFDQDDDMSLLLRARQAVQLLSSRHEEWVELGRIATSMYHTWRQLRQARSRAGVTCTPVTLLINRVENTAGAREGGAVSAAACPPLGATAALEALLDKCRDRFVNPAALAARASAVAHHESTWESRRFDTQTRDQEQEDPAETQAPELAAPGDSYWKYYPSVATLLRGGDALLQRIRAVVSGSALGTVAAGGIAGDGQAYALRLAADDTVVTPEHATTPAERARRVAAGKTRIYTKILVNGKPLTESEHTGGVLTSAVQAASRPVPLRVPGFVAEVGQEVQLQPYARPNTIEVEVWQRGGAMRGGGWSDTQVASVLLPVPGTGAQDGAPTEGIPPVSGAFEFASNRELLRFRGEAVRPDPALAWQGGLAGLAPAAGAGTNSTQDAAAGVTRVDRRLRGVVRVHLEWAPGVLPARPVRLQLSNLRVSVSGLPEPKWGAGGLHFGTGQGPPSSALLIPPVPVGGVNTKKLVGPDAMDPTALAPPGAMWNSPAATQKKGKDAVVGAGGPTTPHRRNTLGGAVNLPDPNDPRARGMRALAPAHADEGGEGGLPNPLTAAMNEAGVGAGGELVGPTGVLRPFREAALQHAAAFLAPALAAATGLSMPEAVGGGSLGAAARGGALTIAGGGRRHRLLRLRAANPEAFAREWPRPVPLSEAEIQNSAPLKRLLALEAAGGFKVERKEDKGGLKSLGFAYGEGEGSVSALMAARAKARAHNYLARIKASKSGQAKYAGGGMADLSRLVRDVRLPTLGGVDLSAIGDIFKPKRSLHPSASGKGVAAAAQQALSADAIRGGDADGASQAKHYIKVHLVRAVNVPRRAGLAALGALGENMGGEELVRRSGTRGAGGYNTPARGGSTRFQESAAGGDVGLGSPIPGMPQGGRMHGMDSSWAAFNEGAEVWAGGADDVQVRCVAEVTFRGAKTVSRGAVGPTPTWNQVVELPLTVPGDSVTPIALASLSSPVTVALFDEVVIERSVGPYSRATTRTLRERRFLGQFSVPFDALYSAGRVEAQMRLTLPPVLFGYAPGTSAAGGEGAMSTTDLPDSQGLVLAAETNRRASHVVMALSVDPPLPPPPPMESSIDKLFGASWFTALQRAARRSLRPRTHAAIAGPPLILGPTPSTSTTATPTPSTARAPPGPAPALGSALTMNSDSDYRRLMSQCYSWAAAAAKRTGRAVQTVVEDIEQQPRLVTQFITPLQPPPAMATAQPVGAEGGPSTPRRLRHGDGSDGSDEDSSAREGGLSFRSSASQGGGVQVGELGEQLLVGPPMSTSEEVTRFVSLVPFLSDIDVFGRHADVWATCAQTLDMGAGDFEEHALLLLNYLMWLNLPDNGGSGIWDDYLVLGSTHDSGESAWVLRYYARTNQVVLINPCSGRSYLGLDATCPLNNIGMLANGKNCFANVQGSGQPWRMRFDVTSTRDWMSMWKPGSDIIPPASIQEPIVYTAPNEAFVEQLQDDVAERLQREFQNWRRSSGHPSCRLTLKFTDKLSMLLEELEQISASQGAPPGTGDGGVGARAVAGIIMDHTNQLSASLSRHELFGFPLCVPFRDLSDVVEHVKHVGLHNTEADNVEFAIECKIVAYANYVMAVWVYLLAIRPK